MSRVKKWAPAGVAISAVPPRSPYSSLRAGGKVGIFAIESTTATEVAELAYAGAGRAILTRRGLAPLAEMSMFTNWALAEAPVSPK